MANYCQQIYKSEFNVLGKNCKRSPHGQEFLGMINTSTSGEPCIQWSNFTNIQFPYFEDDVGNSCRMASSITILDIQYDQPWCFTASGPEDCSVPYCGKRRYGWNVVILYQIHINGLVQDCSISIANALENLQSGTKPSIRCVEDRMSLSVCEWVCNPWQHRLSYDHCLAPYCIHKHVWHVQTTL